MRFAKATLLEYAGEMPFPGFPGVVSALAVFVVVWLLVNWRTKGNSFAFDPGGVPGEFGKGLLLTYLDLMKFIMGIASGSIVLLVGSSNFSPQAGAHSVRLFAPPLFVMAMSIIYGVLCMTYLQLDYEHYRHHPGSNSYTRFRYSRNQALGFSALGCFCLGYAWLVLNAVK
jgi:hypothetical protein